MLLDRLIAARSRRCGRLLAAAGFPLPPKTEKFPPWCVVLCMSFPTKRSWGRLRSRLSLFSVAWGNTNLSWNFSKTLISVGNHDRHISLSFWLESKLFEMTIFAACESNLITISNGCTIET
jgi:hypothetical protein